MPFNLDNKIIVFNLGPDLLSGINEPPLILWRSKRNCRYNQFKLFFHIFDIVVINPMPPFFKAFKFRFIYMYILILILVQHSYRRNLILSIIS